MKSTLRLVLGLIVHCLAIIRRMEETGFDWSLVNEIKESLTDAAKEIEDKL